MKKEQVILAKINSEKKILEIKTMLEELKLKKFQKVQGKGQKIQNREVKSSKEPFQEVK